MAGNPLSDVAIVGVYNTKQARFLEGHTSTTITLDAIRGVLADAGLTGADIDATYISDRNGPLTGPGAAHLLGRQPMRVGALGVPIGAILDGAAAIATGQCHTVLIAHGQAGVYTDRGATGTGRSTRTRLPGT